MDPVWQKGREKRLKVRMNGLFSLEVFLVVCRVKLPVKVFLNWTEISYVTEIVLVLQCSQCSIIEHKSKIESSSQA